MRWHRNGGEGNSENDGEFSDFMAMLEDPAYRYVVPTAAMRRELYGRQRDVSGRLGEKLLQTWRDSRLRWLAAAAIGINISRQIEPSPIEVAREDYVAGVVDQIAADMVFEHSWLLSTELFEDEDQDESA